jgi:hypothetical protein
MVGECDVCEGGGGHVVTIRPKSVRLEVGGGWGAWRGCGIRVP